MTLIAVEKHCPVFFFCRVSLHFQEITYAKKNFSLQHLLSNAKQKKSFALLNNEINEASL